MNIAKLQYEPKYQALEIYLSGCKAPHCRLCHNSELWDFDIGEGWGSYSKQLSEHLSTGIVKNIWILGGCPLDQNPWSLEFMLSYLYKYKKKIWLWTRYELHDIPKNILQYCNYVKTGCYDCNSEPYQEPLFGITLASTNQKIIKL